MTSSSSIPSAPATRPLQREEIQHRSWLSRRGHDSDRRSLQSWREGSSDCLSTRPLAPRRGPLGSERNTMIETSTGEYCRVGKLLDDAQVGTEDGFRRIARTEDNRRLLQDFGNAPSHQCCRTSLQLTVAANPVGGLGALEDVLEPDWYAPAQIGGVRWLPAKSVLGAPVDVPAPMAGLLVCNW